MKVFYYEDYGYVVVREEDHYTYCDAYPTIQALENHIKLMLIAVQNYNKLSQPVQQDDWTFEDDSLYENISKD